MIGGAPFGRIKDLEADLADIMHQIQGGVGTVKTVNNASPDANGNVNIAIPDVSPLATKTEVQAVASGSPKGVYATLSALQTAFPSGNSNIYIVTADGGWYYWSGSAWTKGGTYQSASGIARNSLASSFLNKTVYLDSTYNLDNVVDDGVYIVTTATSKPTGFTSTFAMLEVQSYQDLTDFSSRWIHQTLKDIGNQTVYYTRILDKKTPANNKPWSQITNINRANLAGSFLGGSAYLDSTYDLNNVKDDGVYAVTTATNKPSAFTANMGFLEVQGHIEPGYGARWAIQTLRDAYNLNIAYIRKVDIKTPANNTPWVPITASKFAGKKLLCMGDSITEGAGASNLATTSYPPLIANLTGMVVTNVGHSGARWQRDGSANEPISIVNVASTTNFSTYDYVTIFAGTNDWGGGALPIGTVTDTVENTMCGAINKTLQYIFTSNPSAKVAIITPMFRQRQASGDNLDSDNYTIGGKWLKDYVDAIVSVAKKNHIPVLNMYDECLINLMNYATYLSDGLHPNDTGYVLVANKIVDFLQRIY
jgi:lysophospholipase L1-like esterase